MICWRVSPRVGNVKNNDPSLIEPFDLITVSCPSRFREIFGEDDQRALPA